MSKKGGKINNQAEFLCSTSLLLQNLANKSGGVKKRLPFVLFEHYIRGKRGGAVFYHIDLGQNAVLHNFSRQIALTQYSRRSKHVHSFAQQIMELTTL